MLGRVITSDAVGGKHADVLGYDKLYDHGKVGGATAGNHGTLTGGAFFDLTQGLPTPLQGKTGSEEVIPVRNQDGQNRFVSFGDLKTINSRTFTIVGWLYVDGTSLSGQFFISKWNEIGNQRSWNMNVTTTGIVRFSYSTDGAGGMGIDGGTAIALNRWFHVAIVSDDGNATIYIDNVPDGTGVITTTPFQSSADQRLLSAATGGNGTHGSVAGWRIFRRAVSASELTALFTNTNPPTDAEFDVRSNSGLIQDAEPGAPAGTVSRQFDKNEYCSVPTYTANANALTILGRVRTGDADLSGFIEQFLSAGNQRAWAIFKRASGVFGANVYQDGSGAGVSSKAYDGTTLINDNAWHTIGFTFAPDDLKLYVDGVEENVTKITDGTVNSIHQSTAPVEINGNATTGARTKGLQRDWIVWPRTLSPAEVLDFHNRTVAADSVNAWPLATEANKTAYNIGDLADKAVGTPGPTGALQGYSEPNLGWVKQVPPQLQGQQEYSLSGNGSSQYVDLGAASSLEIPFPLTYAGFIRMNSSGAYTVISTGPASAADVGNYSGATLNFSETALAFRFGDNSGVTSASRGSKSAAISLELDRWYHLAAVATSAADIRLYIDGIDVGGSLGSGTATSVVYDAAKKKCLMSLDAGSAITRHLDGLAAKLEVFNVGLSSDDVVELAAGRSASVQPLAQWLLNDARQYTTYQAWATDALSNGTIYQAGDIAEGIPWNDSPYTENVVMSGAVTTGVIAASAIPSASERFKNGQRATGVRFLQTGNNTCQFIADVAIPVEFAWTEMDFAGLVRSGNGVQVNTGTGHNVHHLLMHSAAITTETLNVINVGAAATGATIHNCFISDCSATTGSLLAVNMESTAASRVQQCSVGQLTGTGAAGITTKAAANLCNNNAVSGVPTSFSGTWAVGSDHNLSSDASAPGDNRVINAAAADVFVDATFGQSDLHLKEDSPAIGAAVSLTGLGIIGSGVDIDGQTWPPSGTVDIGADKYTPALQGGGTGLRVGYVGWVGAVG